MFDHRSTTISIVLSVFLVELITIFFLLSSDAIAAVETGFGDSPGFELDLRIGVISGCITSIETDDSVTCATVRATSIEDKELIVVTDMDGCFYIDRVLPGEYALEVFAPGYADAFRTVIVTNGEEYADIDLEPLGRTTGIRGTVVEEESNNTLAGIHVEAYIGSDLVASTYTCASGDYELTGFDEKSTSLTLNFSGENYETETEEVELETGQTIEVDTKMILKAAMPGLLNGQVRNSDNLEPINGAQIMAGLGGVGHPAYTDDNGEYLILNIPPGTYSVRATAEAYEGRTDYILVQEGTDDVSLDFVLQPLVVHEGESEGELPAEGEGEGKSSSGNGGGCTATSQRYNASQNILGNISLIVFTTILLLVSGYCTAISTMSPSNSKLSSRDKTWYRLFLISMVLFPVMIVFMTLAPLVYAVPAIVSNVEISIREDEFGIVDIFYDIAHTQELPCDISVLLSKDDGETFEFPVTTLSGDVGEDIATGDDKQITWNAAQDFPGEYIQDARIRVLAIVETIEAEGEGEDEGELEGEGEGEGEDEPGPVTPGEMISVPAGSFEMGDPWSESDGDERPVHTVTLSSYEIGQFEVTNQEYVDILNWAQDTGRLTDTSGDIEAYAQKLLEVTSSSCQINYSGGEFVVENRDSYSMADHPVVMVTWYGAVAYCNWLSEANGLQPCYNTSTWVCDFSMNGYHLPTEAQWEQAAAWDPSGDGLPDGSGRHYRYGNGSDSISSSNANYNIDNPLELSAYPYTSPVGYYSGAFSPVGCYDMSGNVWEWCNDWWMREYTFNPVTDPDGPDSGSDRLLRGGGWSYIVDYCSSANRGSYSPEDTTEDFGFRIAQ